MFACIKWIDFLSDFRYLFAFDYQAKIGELKEMTVNINFEKTSGLVPAIAQDHKTGQVLMLAYMNKASFEETLKSGKATYWSRSRNKLWKKGEESGHVQKVKEIRVDCDQDTILLKVDQIGGAACHKGYRSCFYSKVDNSELVITDTKIFDPKEVYK